VIVIAPGSGSKVTVVQENIYAPTQTVQLLTVTTTPKHNVKHTVKHVKVSAVKKKNSAQSSALELLSVTMGALVGAWFTL
jgi:hypothetical protein